MLQAIYRSKPLLRVLSLMLIVCLLLAQYNMIQQQSYAIASELIIGGTAVLMLGMATLLALGLVFEHDEAGQAALRSASQRLMDAACDGVEYVVDGATAVATKIGELLTADAKKGKLVYFPPQNGYKWVAKLGDSTWQKAREWVNENYNPGEISTEQGIEVPLTDFTSGFYNGYYPITQYGSYSIDVTCPIWTKPGHYSVSYKLVDNVPTLSCSATSINFSNIVVNPGDVIRLVRYDNVNLCVFVGTTRYFMTGNTSSTQILSPMHVIIDGDVVAVGTSDVVDNPTYDFVNPTTGDRSLAIPLAIPDASVDPDIAIPGVGDYSVDQDKYVQELTEPDTTPEKVTEEPQTGVDMMPEQEGEYEAPEDAPSWLQMLLNGLVSLVVPSSAQLQAWAVSMKEFCALHLGFLWQAGEIVVDTLSALKTALSGSQISLQDWSVEMPTLTISGEVLYQGGTVHPFEALTDNIWETIHQFIMTFGDAVVLYALVNFGVRKYHQMFGNGGGAQ